MSTKKMLSFFLISLDNNIEDIPKKFDVVNYNLSYFKENNVKNGQYLVYYDEIMDDEMRLFKIINSTILTESNIYEKSIVSQRDIEEAHKELTMLAINNGLNPYGQTKFVTIII